MGTLKHRRLESKLLLNHMHVIPLYGMRTLFYRMHTMDGSGTFRIPLLFFALRRLVYLAWSFVLIQ